jgi:uracil phosphoribosyltransferase
MAAVHVIDHPLVLHKLTLMRNKDTSTSAFRALLKEISMLVAYEVTRDMPLEIETIETPLATMQAPVLRGKKIVLISILRAGIGMLDGVLDILPSARVGHIGLARDPRTLEPAEYYFKVPAGMTERDVILIDPMLATGNSAIAAVERIKSVRPQSIKLMCLVCAPEGIKALHAKHPDVPVFTCAIDQRLDDHGYIVPGLGDAGDRLFGTR